MQKITPFLTFSSEAEEAMNFYVGIFKNAKVLSVNRYPKGSPAPEGSVMTASFELNGLKFVALNAGPMFKFSPATSFVVDCDNQAEVDYYWEKLGEGGKPNRCAWLDDKFGVTWQIVPKQLGQLLSDPDPVKAGRVMQAMMQMGKIDIAGLQRAYDAN
jgi:predicted 3-demethylubiquinone-9 3-methyltransferase (glyoxalase superfamily)